MYHRCSCILSCKIRGSTEKRRGGEGRVEEAVFCLGVEATRVEIGLLHAADEAEASRSKFATVFKSFENINCQLDIELMRSILLPPRSRIRKVSWRITNAACPSCSWPKVPDALQAYRCCYWTRHPSHPKLIKKPQEEELPNRICHTSSRKQLADLRAREDCFSDTQPASQHINNFQILDSQTSSFQRCSPPPRPPIKPMCTEIDRSFHRLTSRNRGHE